MQRVRRLLCFWTRLSRGPKVLHERYPQDRGSVETAKDRFLTREPIQQPAEHGPTLEQSRDEVTRNLRGTLYPRGTLTRLLREDPPLRRGVIAKDAGIPERDVEIRERLYQSEASRARRVDAGRNSAIFASVTTAPLTLRRGSGGKPEIDGASTVPAYKSKNRRSTLRALLDVNQAVRVERDCVHLRLSAQHSRSAARGARPHPGAWWQRHRGDKPPPCYAPPAPVPRQVHRVVGRLVGWDA